MLWFLLAPSYFLLVAAQRPTFSAHTSTRTHDVDVGKHGLVFEPESLEASIGDIINFHFYPVNHSIAQSTFNKPCQPLNGRDGQIPVFSGFLPVTHGASSHMFSMRVNGTDPMWLYCSQTYHDHCPRGQVMVVNPLLNSGQTLELYKEAARHGNTSSPTRVYGGVLIANVETPPFTGAALVSGTKLPSVAILSHTSQSAERSLSWIHLIPAIGITVFS